MADAIVRVVENKVVVSVAGADLLAPLVASASASALAAAESAASAQAASAAEALVTEARTVSSLKDTNGDFLSGTAADGRTIGSAYPNRARLEVRRIGSADQIFAADHLGSTQMTHSGSNWAPEWIRGAQIRFTSDRRGQPELYVMREDGSAQIPASPVVTEHWQVVGQSLAVGSNTSDTGATGLALTTTPQTPGAFMFALTGGAVPHGPRPFVDTLPISNDRTLDTALITGLTPLSEQAQGVYGETVCSGFAAQYMRDADPAMRLLMDSHGRGSSSWLPPTVASPEAYIAPGSYPFSHGQALQVVGRQYVEGAGGAYLLAGILDLHGERDSYSDTTTTYSQYLQYQKDKIAAYNRHSHTRSRFHRRRRMYSKQLSSMRVADHVRAFDIARAQAQAALDDPTVVCVGPAYTLLHGDQIHLRAAGQRQMGEMMGKWARRVEREGQALKPFVAYSAVRSGAVVRVKFYVPVPPLVLDTTAVSAIANSGVTYEDDSASGVTVTSVALVTSDPSALDVTLSSASVGANPRLNIAKAPTTANQTGPTAGARSNIRDSDTERGKLSGVTLHNWACHWQVGITT